MADFGVTEYLALASLAASAVGAAASAAGAEQQGKANSAMYAYQAQVAQNNQVIANQLAAQATQAGEANVDTKRLQTAGVIGSELAAQGASGLDVNKGSNVDVRSSAAELGELDALTIRNNAARTAYGYQVQGLNYGAQASLNTAGSQSALTAGNLQAFTSLAGGAGSVSEKFLRFNQAGLFK